MYNVHVQHETDRLSGLLLHQRKTDIEEKTEQ